MKKYNCEACGGEFVEGTGHKMWCPDCKSVHGICEECYVREKASGNIKDKKINIGQLDNPDRYT